MTEETPFHAHQLAWSLYLAAAAVFYVIWHLLTSRLRQRGLRDFLRGLALVCSLTPWYATAAREHLAPAALVAVMDLGLGDPNNGLLALLALAATTAIMALLLLARRLIMGKPPNARGGKFR